jgi:hypothetical protein
MPREGNPSSIWRAKIILLNPVKHIATKNGRRRNSNIRSQFFQRHRIKASAQGNL